MSMITLMSAVAALAVQSAPIQQTPVAQAAIAEAPAEAPAEAEDPRLDEVTCRTEPVVGSRFNSRICMTRREWNQRRDESRRLVHRLDTQNSNRDRITAPGH